MDVVALLGAVLGALAINALFNELLEWQPRFRNWCLRLIVRRLPEAERELRLEEWAAHMNDCPGTFSKLLLLVGFWLAAHDIAREAGSQQQAQQMERGIALRPPVSDFAAFLENYAEEDFGHEGEDR